MRPVTSPDSVSRRDRLFFGVATALVASILWLLPIGSSLWLDETGTYYLVKDGLGPSISRSLEYGGTSPLYAVVAWLTTSIEPHSEVALRLPSLIATAIATFLLFRLARMLFGAKAAWISVAVFVSSGLAAFAADDARPQALALVCLLGSTLLMTRWLDERRPIQVIGYFLLAALAVHFQYLFLLALASQLPYVWARLPSRRIRVVGSGALLLSLTLAPSIPQLLSIFDRRSILALPDPVTVAGLLSVIVPWSLVTGSALGLAFGRLTSRIDRSRPSKGSTVHWTLVIPWLIAPPLVLFTAARLFNVSAFSPRHFVMVVPPLALGTGAALSRLEPARVRRIVVATVLVVGTWSSLSTVHLQPQFSGAFDSLWGAPGLEWNWRQVAAVVNAMGDDHQDVLMDSGFVEGQSLEWLTDPKRAGALLAPTAFYPIRGRLVPVPRSIDRATTAYMEQLVQSRLEMDSRFVLVTTTTASTIRAWLHEHLMRFDVSSRVVWGTGATWVVLFAKSPSALAVAA